MTMKTLFYGAVSAFPALLFLTSCSEEISQSIDIDLNPTPSKEAVLAPSIAWDSDRDAVTRHEGEDFVLSYDRDGTRIYEYTGEEDMLHSYSFSDDGKLHTSALMIPSSSPAMAEAAKLYKDYTHKGKKGDMDIYSNEKLKCAATRQLAKGIDGKEYCVIGFSSYVPSQEETDPEAPYVDLGLSVAWGKCNVGADKPEEEGDYYAWSETRTKDEYWGENYEFCTKKGYSFIYDNPRKEISGTIYDPATKYMGEDWRMPTKEEANELIYKCTWTSTTQDGVRGFIVTGPNGNSIFLPRTYNRRGGEQGNKVQVWTGTSLGYEDSDAYVIYFPVHINKDLPSLMTWFKYSGNAIRPVYDPK